MPCDAAPVAPAENIEPMQSNISAILVAIEPVREPGVAVIVDDREINHGADIGFRIIHERQVVKSAAGFIPGARLLRMGSRRDIDGQFPDRLSSEWRVRCRIDWRRSGVLR